MDTLRFAALSVSRAFLLTPTHPAVELAKTASQVIDKGRDAHLVKGLRALDLATETIMAEFGDIIE